MADPSAERQASNIHEFTKNTKYNQNALNFLWQPVPMPVYPLDFFQKE